MSTVDSQPATTTSIVAGSWRLPALRHVAARASLPLFSAALLGVLEMWGTIGSGYFAGWGDHVVLSAEGIRWADPTAFRGDWFIENSPQPHWFFDIVTFAGESLGILSTVYVLYWSAGLLAFGLATAMIARRFAPGLAWQAVTTVTIVAGVIPWALGGTGTFTIPQALPAVLSANLVYLLLASALTSRRTLVVVLAPAVAVVHVQQGSIVLIMLIALQIVSIVTTRKLDLGMIAATGLTAAAVVFGLAFRPVASNLGDFVRICDEVIPYHCAAHLWTPQELISTVGLISLTALSSLVFTGVALVTWRCTVGLALLGYTVGFGLDAIHVPFLGPLAQGVNVYRLAAVLVPFAVWGIVAPFLRRSHGRRRIVLLVLWGAAWAALLVAPNWPTPLVLRVVLTGLALGAPLAWLLLRASAAPGRRQRSAALFAGGLLVLTVTGAIGGLQVRAPNVGFIGSSSLREWGRQVADLVEPGEVVIAPPRYEWVKLVSRRAVVADCKDVPYGGAAWDQWQARLETLGGYAQCVAPGPLLYNDLSPSELVELANTWDSDFIVVDPSQTRTVEGLQRLGWDWVVMPIENSGADVLRRG